MNTVEHLTETQLSDYLGNAALDKETKHQIGRHLLQCDFCLKRLPQPTTEQFWAALMTDEADDSLDERITLAERLNYILQSLKQPKVFALSAAALAVLIFFSAFIWLNAAKSSEMEREVAQNFEKSEPIFNQNGDEPINPPSILSLVESSNPFSPASPSRTTAKPNSLATNNSAKHNLKILSRTDFNLKTPMKSADGAEKVNISSTRGGSSVLPKCDGAVTVEMTTGSKGEAVTLKWKKLPKATKYHLYVSDDDEILVDEFETEEKTSYVLKKSLDPVKTYQWKVVITLEDGSTVVGDSQKFTIKNFQPNQKKSERKEKSDIRCLQQN